MMKFLVVTLFCLVLVGSALSFRIKGKSPQVDPRIVNGEEAVPHSLPWQAYIELSDKYGELSSSCGGSLISPYYILTAAHCVSGISSANIVLGAHNLTSTSESPTWQNFTSTDLRPHKGFDYESGSVDNDIALIKLPQAAIFTDAVKPVNLSRLPSEQLVGKRANLSGWGLEDARSFFGPDTLRVTQIEISENSVCDVWAPYNATLSICSNGPKDHGPCDGDSGGPLTVDGTLVGIVSYGSTTCNATTGKPAAFTRISYYIDWIKKNTN